MPGPREAPHPTPADASRTVLLVGFPAPQARRIAAQWPVLEATLEALPTLAEAEPHGAAAAVVCLGPDVPPPAVAAFLARQATGSEVRYLVLAAGDEAERFEPFIQRDQLFYLSAQPPASAAVVALLAAALGRSAAATEDQPVASSWEVLPQISAIEETRGLETALERLEEAARALVVCRRAEGRWVDAATLTLWRPDDDERWDSIAAGLVGFVARTGKSVLVPRVGEDARYDAEADNDRRSPRERLLAVGLPAGPGAEEPQAVDMVLSLVRGGRQAPFTAGDQAYLEQLAREAGPILRRRRLAAEMARQERETAVFRREALVHHEAGLQTRAEPLRIAPAWLGRAYRGVLAMCAASLLVVPFAGSDELAAGPAVVRLEARTEVRARAAGVLERLDVKSGDRVRGGEVIGRLESAEEEAALEQVQQELTLRLVERLRHPEQTAAVASFVTLREQERVVAARLERRRLRAPQDGVVGDLLARTGRPLSPGQPVLSLTTAGAAAEPAIEVLLPGRFRPLLTPGMAMRFKVDGYPDVEQRLTVDEISQQVIDAGQIPDILESASTNTLGAAGGLIIVRAALPTEDFDSAGERYAFYDGMTGTAEIRVRKKRWFVDWLRRLV